jgi:hypothetical protein
MSAEGFFHDAHEVYFTTSDMPRTWIATFSTKAFAEGYIELTTGHAFRFECFPDDGDKWEVVPV